MNILPSKDGLVHISKLATGFLNHPEDVVKEGDKLKVKVAEVRRSGRGCLVSSYTLVRSGGTTQQTGGYSGGGDRRPDSEFRTERIFQRRPRRSPARNISRADDNIPGLLRRNETLKNRVSASYLPKSISGKSRRPN